MRVFLFLLFHAHKLLFYYVHFIGHPVSIIYFITLVLELEKAADDVWWDPSKKGKLGLIDKTRSLTIINVTALLLADQKKNDLITWNILQSFGLEQQHFLKQCIKTIGSDCESWVKLNP